MCGIVAYLGHKPVVPILINGLKRLEYRGYDSSGVALLSESDLQLVKKKGKVEVLENELLAYPDLENFQIGIAHTRWATHGVPSDANAHPHRSMDGKLALVHNGIIENYAALKSDLERKGYFFESDTDTEVVAKLIEEILSKKNCSLEEAVRLAIHMVVGAFALVVIHQDFPNTLVATRKGSPLVLGLGDHEFYLASDATPIVEYTKRVIYLDDLELVVVKDGSFTIRTIDNEDVDPFIQTLEIELDEIEKGGFDYFMLKEIYEQPKSVTDSLRGRLDTNLNTLVLGGLKDHIDILADAKKLILTACGTSWHACLVAEYLFENLAKIPVEVEYASEFRYRNPALVQGDVLIAVSQSGETADTLAAIELAKSKGVPIFGVCNVVGSSIARATDAGCYIHAGPEIGVASTKAFTGQITVLTLMALKLAKRKGMISESDFENLLKELELIPSKINQCLKSDQQIEEMANAYSEARNFLYLGRGVNFPVALEGALKLKEISYIHAEGYPAAEMKHGPIALIDEEMPVVVIAVQDSIYEKVVSNIQEVKARKGKVIGIVTEGDETVSAMVDHVIEIPKTLEYLTPLLSVIPLQLLAYHIAVKKGCNVDQPRNLAKSVTVE